MYYASINHRMCKSIENLFRRLFGKLFSPKQYCLESLTETLQFTIPKSNWDLTQMKTLQQADRHSCQLKTQ